MTGDAARSSFKTDNMAEAAALSMHGLEFTVEQKNGTRVLFCFIWPVDDARINTLIDQLQTNQLRVDPKRFAVEWRYVRDRMYSHIGPSQRRRLS